MVQVGTATLNLSDLPDVLREATSSRNFRGRIVVSFSASTGRPSEQVSYAAIADALLKEYHRSDSRRLSDKQALGSAISYWRDLGDLSSSCWQQCIECLCCTQEDLSVRSLRDLRLPEDYCSHLPASFTGTERPDTTALLEDVD